MAPINIDNKQNLRYKERESPALHIEQVSKKLGEHVQLQILVKTFTVQVARWWDTHQSRLQTWTTGLTFFIERFGGRNITKHAQIHVFIEGQDPENHIKTCEKEWRRLGYKEECTWPHLFPSTLTDFQKKWYKMEKARGETFLWHELKDNFIKDFNFEPHNENLVKTTKQIKAFVQPTENKTLKDN